MLRGSSTTPLRSTWRAAPLSVHWRRRRPACRSRSPTRKSDDQATRRGAQCQPSRRAARRGRAGDAGIWRWRRRHAADRDRGAIEESSEQAHDNLYRRCTSRIDGRAKVTGAAKNSGGVKIAGLAHASVVASTIARGRITRIDTSDAFSVAGVIDVLTHKNPPPMASDDSAYNDEAAPE